MTNIRVGAAVNRAFSLTDFNIHNNLEIQREFRKQTILADKSLTYDEKLEAIKNFNKNFDYFKIRFNEGTKRICENCQKECLATLYCEHCIQDYLRANFSNWTSGNNDVDNLIQKCQIETMAPHRIVEWIPYDNLINIEYLTKGGFSKIYTAVWIDGKYEEWDSKKRQLRRFGRQKVILKKLENIESAGRSWFEEGKSHLTISNKYGLIVQCYGLTIDPSDGNYMLVINRMRVNLRNFLQQNNHILSWKERVQFIQDIISALYRIHKENAIHRDLHSGNILYQQIDHRFLISDLGFCGPVDKPLNSVYGNLPYIAPEVIFGKETSFASDIYSFGMLMWEISSGKPPFIDHSHDYYLAIDIINGRRPQIVPGTPLEYKRLMVQCWDANPTKRPDAYTIWKEIRSLNRNENEVQFSNDVRLVITPSSISSTSINFLVGSKIYNFEGLPEPRNATEEGQEGNHSKPYSFNVPDNIDK